MTNIEYFKTSGYGMMMHFGLYSLLAGEYKGKRLPEDREQIGEWIMKIMRIPVSEYEKLAEAFIAQQIEEIKENLQAAYVVQNTAKMNVDQAKCPTSGASPCKNQRHLLLRMWWNW